MRDPKSLPEWLELDYYQRPRKLRRMKRLALWLVALLSGAGLAYAFLPENREVFEAGPVSQAHSMFHSQCEVCHVKPFLPVRRLLPNLQPLPSAMDQACLSCHDGAVHHAKQSFEPGCATCHQEHRGNDQLARVSDDHCTRCHANLKRDGLKAGATTDFLDVRAFVFGQHPEFKIWRSQEPADPGTIRFNHKLHLAPSGVLGSDGKKHVLDCQNCHRLDAQRQYMQPVQYEQDCASCHPLTVPIVGNWQDQAIAEAKRKFELTPVPHTDPLLVRSALRQRFSEFVRQWRGVLGTPVRQLPRPLPGHLPPTEIVEAEGQWIDRQMQKAEQFLFTGVTGCRYCHQVTGFDKADLPLIAPANITTPWLKHSRFSHDSHRMLQCGECHPTSESSQTRDLSLPRIQDCMTCHNETVQARTDCVECHRYHDRTRERTVGTKRIEEVLPKTTPWKRPFWLEGEKESKQGNDVHLRNWINAVFPPSTTR
ncbi:MAG: hypothetical protein KatS3mg105_1965 [Gemmatales bacterium]|nr:MAG: hypothetical protein KatS3mg105_1965 [Gemmatales bacterium]